MLVVGEKERDNKEVSIREHKKGDTGKSGLKEFIEKVKLQINQKL
jgi:threonyl-tRNA synthetase